MSGVTGADWAADWVMEAGPQTAEARRRQVRGIEVVRIDSIFTRQMELVLRAGAGTLNSETA
jgi:hypothetical protein